MFSFLRKSQTVLQSNYTPFYSPNRSVWGFEFLHILINTCNYLSFYDGHPSGCEVISSCGFDFAFLWSLMILSICSYAFFPPFVYLLWRNAYSDPLHILKLGLLLSCKSSFYSRYKSLIRWFAKIFSHFVGYLHFLDVVLWKTF